MKRAVFVSREKDQFAIIEQMLSRKNIDVEKTETGKELLSLLSNTTSETLVDLVIIDQALEDTQAKPLVEAVTAQSPFTNCIVAGNMEDKDFHDFFEGYGVLMQIAQTPGPEDAKRLENHLDKLTELNGL